MADPARARSSLRSRVAYSAAAIGAIVGLASAGTAALLSSRLELDAEDGRLADAATLLARELQAPSADIRKEADDEAAEVAPLGIALAVFSGGEFAGGTRDVVLPASGGCSTARLESGAVRTCAFPDGPRTIVVSAHVTAVHSPGVLGVAVAAATLIAALLAGIASWFAARWALAPLGSLRRALAKVPVEDPRRADLGAPSTSADVEELRVSVRGLLDRLGSALDASRRFGANAAHELRTPLATVMAELDLLDADDREAVARIRRSVARLSVLVDRLLAMSRPIEAILRDDAVALDDVVREIVADRAPVDRARIDVVSDVPGMVRGDEVVLRVVVDNLVDNALKFGGEGRVSIAIEEREADVEVVVRDGGPGLGAADVERLLEPFVRGENEQALPAGFGLGLAIAAHGARIHGGALTFGVPASGAEVHVTLPAWSAREAPP